MSTNRQSRKYGKQIVVTNSPSHTPSTRSKNVHTTRARAISSKNPLEDANCIQNIDFLLSLYYSPDVPACVCPIPPKIPRINVSHLGGRFSVHNTNQKRGLSELFSPFLIINRKRSFRYDSSGLIFLLLLLVFVPSFCRKCVALRG